MEGILENPLGINSRVCVLCCIWCIIFPVMSSLVALNKRCLRAWVSHSFGCMQMSGLDLPRILHCMVSRQKAWDWGIPKPLGNSACMCSSKKFSLIHQMIVVDFTWGCVVLLGWWNSIPSLPHTELLTTNFRLCSFQSLLLVLSSFVKMFQHALEHKHELLAPRWEPYFLDFHLVLSTINSLFLLCCILNHTIQKEAAFMKKLPITCDSALWGMWYKLSMQTVWPLLTP